jgi:small-conductance mechanosensitive channel
VTETRSRTFFLVVLSVGLFGFYLFVQVQPLPFGDFGDVREVIFGRGYRGLLFAVLVPIIFLLVRLFDYLAFDLARKRKVAAPRLLRDIVSLGLYFLLFSWAVSVIFKYSLTRWLAATTILAAVLALALQQTLGNLFSGIALHLEDAFEVGDVLNSGDHTGVVEGWSWRATKIRTFANNNLVYLPNSVLAGERLEVYPRNNFNARLIQVGIDYNTPPAVVIPVLTQATAHIEGVSRDIPCFARVATFGESSVVYEIKYFTREYEHRDRIDADVKKAIWYALRRNGISIPFPIRSLQRYRPPIRDDHTLPREAIRERLEQVDVLSPLSDEAHETLAAAATVHFYSRGETILRYGSVGESMSVVHEGTVSVRIVDDSAAGRHEVAQLGPGSVIGEMALLTGETRAADVVALTDVTTVEITKEALQPILQDHPELAAAISARVTERRQRLHELRSATPEEDELTIRTRILSFFGLRGS